MSSAEHREAARRAVGAARATPVRRRHHLPPGLRDAGGDLVEGVFELLAMFALLLTAAAVAALVRWGWAQAPTLTVAAVAVVVGAEVLGLLDAVRAIRSHRRVRRLPALALGVAGIVGWGVGTAVFYVGWW